MRKLLSLAGARRITCGASTVTKAPSSGRETEAECNKLRELNTEIAHSSCIQVDRPVVGAPPPNPAQQTPTQR